MRFRSFILIIVLSGPCMASGADVAKAPPTRPVAVVESKPVVKDRVSIVVGLKQQAISTNAEPQLVVRFTNVGGGYVNLYDVNAYFDWDIEFTSAEKGKGGPRSLALRMDKLPHRIAIAHRQIKAGESLEVNVDLSDPPFTFHYEDAHPAEGAKAASVRHLSPGNWRVAVTVKLQHPFGDNAMEWAGPLTTEPVELVVGPPNPDENAEPTPEQAAAYSAAIHRYADRFDGMWLNGRAPEIKLPSDAKVEDVIEAAVNQTILESRAYRILRVEPFTGKGLPQTVAGSAAVVRVGTAYKVVIFFPYEKSGWWSRFYDAELPGAGGAQ